MVLKRLWVWLTRCVAPVLTARTIASAAAAGVVRRTTQCTDMRLQCCHMPAGRCLKVPPSRYPIGPPAPDTHLPLGAVKQKPSARQLVLLLSSVDHSTPPQVPKYRNGITYLIR
jgi:hypothetical protein